MNLHKKNAESIIWVIIAVSILLVIMLWVLNILIYWKDITSNYWDDINLIFLKASADNIIKNLNTNSVQNWEEFYIYKDKNTKEYQVFTWSINETYKYIDKSWNNINPNNSIWTYYSRIYKKNVNIWSWEDLDSTIEYEAIDVSIEKYN
jgi:hypothetical protein